MSVNITNINSNTHYNASFRGTWKQTEKGIPYYSSNSATKTGAIVAVPAAILWLNQLNIPTTKEEIINQTKDVANMFNFTGNNIYKEMFTKKAEEDLNKIGIDNIIKKNKIAKKLAIPFALIASGASVGIGFFVDKKRNQKAQEIANSVKLHGVKNTVKLNDSVSLTKKGNAYYESNQGAKNGVAVGAACGILHNAMLLKPKSNILDYIACAGLFAFGGWVVGKIADNITNKNVKNNV